MLENVIGTARLLWATKKTVGCDWLVAPQTHAYCQALIVTAGRVALTIDGEERVLERNECAYIGPYRKHSAYAAPKASLLEAKFFVHDPTLRQALDEVPAFFDLPAVDVRRCLERIVSEGKRKAPYYEAVVNAAIEEFLWYIARIGGRSPEGEMHDEDTALKGVADDTSELVMSIIKYLEESLREDLTLEGLGKKFGYNPAYLCGKFSAIAGMPPMRYLTLLRVQKAKELLRDPNRTLRHVAWDVGFNSEQHFSRVFQRETGLSPSAFRANLSMRTEVYFVDDALAVTLGLK